MAVGKIAATPYMQEERLCRLWFTPSGGSSNSSTVFFAPLDHVPKWLQESSNTGIPCTLDFAFSPLETEAEWEEAAGCDEVEQIFILNLARVLEVKTDDAKWVALASNGVPFRIACCYEQGKSKKKQTPPPDVEGVYRVMIRVCSRSGPS